jgi:hypothetical protein
MNNEPEPSKICISLNGVFTKLKAETPNAGGTTKSYFPHKN